MLQRPSVSERDSGNAFYQAIVESSITVHHVCLAVFNDIVDKHLAFRLESVMHCL